MVSFSPCSVEFGTKAAETLWCASGGVPAASAEAAATRDRRDRERQAVRSWSGPSSSPSKGWRGVVHDMGASPGCSHE